MVDTIPDELLENVILNESISVIPVEFGGNTREKAYQNLQKNLNSRGNIIQVQEITFKDIPMVLPGQGAITYQAKVKAIVFVPKEGYNVKARIEDILPTGVFLRIANVRCLLPALFLSRHRAELNTAMKSVTIPMYDPQTYSIGDYLLVNLSKLRREGFETRAICDLVVSVSN